MTRTFILLIAAAFFTCLVGVPVVLLSGGDDAPTHKTAIAKAAVDDDDRSPDRGRFAWLIALPFARAQADAAMDDDAHLGPALAHLDQKLADGILRCAPEILGYDRALLVRLQPDWHVLKPNLRPSWDAWRSVDGVVVDDEKVRNCAEIFARGDCARMQESWEECTVPFRGTLGEGESCDTNEQCASGVCNSATCSRPNDCAASADCPGGMLCADDGTGFLTCVDKPGNGAACVDAIADPKAPDADLRCGEGLGCDEDNRCAPTRREGERCGAGQPCGRSLACVIHNDEPAVCEREEEIDDAAPDPEAAEMERALEARLNQDDLADAANAEAEADADPGCACDPFRDGKACVEGRSPGRQRCVPVQVVDNGAACDAVHICRGSLGVNACIDGRCAEARATGETCGDHDQCKDDLVCIDSACAAPHRAGEGCATSDECTFGLECLFREGTGKSACSLPKYMSSGERPDVERPLVIEGAVLDALDAPDAPGTPDTQDAPDNAAAPDDAPADTPAGTPADDGSVANGDDENTPRPARRIVLVE